LEEFISKNASAIFGLLGALGGGSITFFTTWLIKKREYDLRLWDKLLERDPAGSVLEKRNIR